MKHKLLAIGILALVLCATVPAAATAKPTTAQPKIVKFVVYKHEWDQYYNPVLGSPIGSMSVDLATGKFSATVKMDPSQLQFGQGLKVWLVGQQPSTTWWYSYDAYSTSPVTNVITKTGVVHISGTFNSFALEELQYIYSGKSVFKAADYGSTWWFFVDTWE